MTLTATGETQIRTGVATETSSETRTLSAGLLVRLLCKKVDPLKHSQRLIGCKQLSRVIAVDTVEVSRRICRPWAWLSYLRLMQYCAVKLKTSQNGLVQVTGVKGRAPKVDFLKPLD